MKVALVTGANRGLGLAAVAALARMGITVFLTGRDGDRADEAAAVLRGEGLDVRSIRLDVTDQASIDAARKYVEQTVGRLDILVNNAGIVPEATDTAAHELANPALFQATFATNVFGVAAVTEAFSPLLRRSDTGRIVNLSTTMGSLSDQANPDSPYYQAVAPAYQSSKAALNSLTISMAKKLAGSPVKVTSVCPGFVQTDLTPDNRAHAPMTAGEAVSVVIAAATLPDDAPSGSFVDRNGPIAW
jgi:NAD(P)-dependent dehydrogenase (short-subunit alcohol dehydrogenase family)